MVAAVANPKILIVEDETFIANLYKKEFVSHGAVVDIAANGEEGLARLEKGKYQVVLLDLLMPVMDGFQMLQALKGKKGVLPPVIVVSNVSENLMWEQCKKLGATDFITKSDVDASDVWKIVAKHLGQA